VAEFCFAAVRKLVTYKLFFRIMFNACPSQGISTSYVEDNLLDVLGDDLTLNTLFSVEHVSSNFLQMTYNV
jgi:hypothetical protein